MTNKSYNNKKNINPNKIKTNIISQLSFPSVSIITITQLKRFDCLVLLYDAIKNQTYSNIIEWVIVEGSMDESNKIMNKSNIELFIHKHTHTNTHTKSAYNLKIKYIYPEKITKLGELRNIGNKSCIGDITVCMDDDDYYPSVRVEHAVEKLSNSKCLIAGCSNIFMYDYDLKLLAQLKTFRPNHSVNSCMAWKKVYLESHSHNPEAIFAEEDSFTNGFTVQMVQLEPSNTIILSSHSANTFCKKIFYIQKLNDINCLIDKIIPEYEITTNFKNFMSKDILEKYSNIFLNYAHNTEQENFGQYDIIYMCGTLSIKWDPIERDLGGSEQAVVNLSENWVRMEKKVVVFGEVPDKIINGVVYKHWSKFNYNIKYKTIIVWRLYGMITICPFKINADQILFDVHDNYFGDIGNTYIKYWEIANKIMVKSNYHKECLIDIIKKSNLDKKISNEENEKILNIAESKIISIPNGIRIELFDSNLNTSEIIQRNPYRFCYCSCYTRGLDKIIGIIWPIIYSYEPRAELHVYYGMNGITNEQYKNYLKMLLAQPGVMDHSRQPVGIISREK